MKERQMSHIMSHYFAPRGRGRMYALGMQLAQLYLSPSDKLHVPTKYPARFPM